MDSADSARRKSIVPWVIVIAIVLIVAAGVGAYFLLTADDRACEEFHEAVTQEYFPGEALDAGFQDRLIRAIYEQGQFTNRQGEVVTKPEGCEPP